MIIKGGYEMKKRPPVLLYLITSIAAVGLLSYIFKQPGQLLKSLMVIAIIATIIILVTRTIMSNRYDAANRAEMRKYRQAVKQSKKRYKNHHKNQNQAKQNRHRRRKKPSHLTVIEGNKNRNKNNDRASN